MSLYCCPDKRVEQANEEQAEVIDMLTNANLALQTQLRDLQSYNNDLAATNDRINADRREDLRLLERQKDAHDQSHFPGLNLSISCPLESARAQVYPLWHCRPYCLCCKLYPVPYICNSLFLFLLSLEAISTLYTLNKEMWDNEKRERCSRGAGTVSNVWSSLLW